MSTWPACEAGGMLAFHDVHGEVHLVHSTVSRLDS